MTEAEENNIIEVFKEAIHAGPETEIGPIVRNAREIWINVAGQLAYLGGSYEAALLTARLSDWWIPERAGNLMKDDREWFETRAKLGNGWENRELPMFKEERRTRLAQNIQLATSDEPDNEPEN